MENIKKLQKTPTIFKVFGVLSIIGGSFVILSTLSILSLMGMAGGFAVILLPDLLMGILTIAAGIGFLGLKKWLPWLLIVQMGLSILTFVYFSTSIELFEGTDMTTLIVGLIIGGLLTAYTYKRRTIFVN
jgi:hypothetical protein